MQLPPLLRLLLATALSAAGGQPKNPEANLTHGISLLEHFQEDEAESVFKDLLREAPSESIAAKAHLYLGLIAMNHVHLDEARGQFVQAIAANPAIELPFNSAPKVQLVFAEAFALRRRSLSAEQSLPNSPAPGTVLDREAPAVQAAAPARYHLASWGLGALAVAAEVLAGYGIVQVESYDSLASSARVNQYTFTQLQAAQSNAFLWRGAWVPLALGGALAGAAAVVLW